MTQPEALRLADALIHRHGIESFEADAAAELRRLHAENESLRQIVEDFPPVEAELREVSDRAHRLERQRDALLEALKLSLRLLRTHVEPEAVGAERFDLTDSKKLAPVFAAIAKAEENT